MVFKFGANNLNFIRARLGKVRLGYVMFILMLFTPQMSIFVSATKITATQMIQVPNFLVE